MKENPRNILQCLKAHYLERLEQNRYQLMDYHTLIGLSAGVLTTVPQLSSLIKLIKDKRIHRYSLVKFLFPVFGLALWIGYGFLISDWIIVSANTVALVITILYQATAAHYKRRIRKKELYVIYHH